MDINSDWIVLPEHEQKLEKIETPGNNNTLEFKHQNPYFRNKFIRNPLIPISNNYNNDIILTIPNNLKYRKKNIDTLETKDYSLTRENYNRINKYYRLISLTSFTGVILGIYYYEYLYNLIFTQ